MIQYNYYNRNYSEQITHLYNNFNMDDVDSYLELLKLIYEVYFYDNIFIVVDRNVKYELNSVLTLLSNKFNSYYGSNEEIYQLISVVKAIQKEVNITTNFTFPEEIVGLIQTVLLLYGKINEQFIQKGINVFSLCGQYDEISIRRFFTSFGIDFSKNMLNICGVNVPNFSLYQKNKDIDHLYEFFHLLFKIYAPLMFYGSSFQEGYEYNITEEDIVFDCGGNMGLFALYAASKGAQVYCFEPMSYIRDFLEISQSLYPNNIKIIPCGVGNKECETSFVQTYNPGASNLEQFDLIHSPVLYSEKCKIITLDEFCESNNIIPTFIKADIEGAEVEMLKGAKNVLTKHKPTMHLCLNHRPQDKYIILTEVDKINPNYEFFTIYEGSAQSEYVLCR